LRRQRFRIGGDVVGHVVNNSVGHGHPCIERGREYQMTHCCRTMLEMASGHEYE
jgi:hypothetical protein